jgi:NAD(P)-dependent dehydrogenase (short-subunit alcohol dehydrogenase family)
MPAEPVFAGKVVVVTGASSGIGRALCLELAAQKPRLVLAARDETALGEVAVACESRGAETLAVPTDVSSEEECRRLIDRSVEKFGAIDALVANAGITMWSTFEEMQDLSLYEKVMQVNFLGAVYPTFYALPHLKKTRGRIVAVSSLAGFTGVPTRTGYAASKHALFGFFDSLRIELRGSGVTVTMIAPDFVLSEIHRRAVGADGKPLGKSPMQESKIMSAEECARHIVSAMKKRSRLWIGSARGRLGRWIRLVAPGRIDSLAARAIREGR